MITIKITTSALPPIPIKAFIDNIENNNFDIHFNPIIGYEHKFNLPKGDYIFSVSGMNGLKKVNGEYQLGKTSVSLEGNIELGPTPNSPLESNDEFFILAYKLKI